MQTLIQYYTQGEMKGYRYIHTYYEILYPCHDINQVILWETDFDKIKQHPPKTYDLRDVTYIINTQTTEINETDNIFHETYETNLKELDLEKTYYILMYLQL